jgi:hypothetical protein
MPSNTVSTLKRKTHIDSNGTKEAVTVSRRQGNRILEVIDKQAKSMAGKAMICLGFRSGYLQQQRRPVYRKQKKVGKIQ